MLDVVDLRNFWYARQSKNTECLRMDALIQCNLFCPDPFEVRQNSWCSASDFEFPISTAIMYNVMCGNTPMLMLIASWRSKYVPVKFNLGRSWHFLTHHNTSPVSYSMKRAWLDVPGSSKAFAKHHDSTSPGSVQSWFVSMHGSEWLKDLSFFQLKRKPWKPHRSI